jgi:hypothetical protein
MMALAPVVVGLVVVLVLVLGLAENNFSSLNRFRS